MARLSGSSAGSCAIRRGGRVSRKNSMTRNEGIEKLRSLPIRDRLPDPWQRDRGRGRGAGDPAALPVLPYTAHVAQSLPRSRGHAVSDFHTLRSARARRETTSDSGSLGARHATDPYEDPARPAELADSVSMAALLLLERLTPLERAVFVLREGSPSPRSHRPSVDPRPRAANSRPGRDATWTLGGLDSRRTAANARS